MPFYRKKPEIVAAEQWTGLNADYLIRWCTDDEGDGSFEVDEETYIARIFVEARQQWFQIRKGEWILKDEVGFSPCKDVIFKRLYEPINGEVFDDGR